MNPVSGSSLPGNIHYLGSFGSESDELQAEEDGDPAASGLESLMDDPDSPELNRAAREETANVQWVIQKLVNQVERAQIEEETPLDETPRLLACPPSQVRDLGELKLFLIHYLVQVEKVCAAWPGDNEAVCQLREELRTWIAEDPESQDLDSSIRYWEDLVAKIQEDDSSFANEELPPLSIKR